MVLTIDGDDEHAYAGVNTTILADARAIATASQDCVLAFLVSEGSRLGNRDLTDPFGR